MRFLLIFLCLFSACVASMGEKIDKKIYEKAFYKVVHSEEYIDYINEFSLGHLTVSSQLIPAFPIKRYFVEDLELDVNSYALEIYSRNLKEESIELEELAELSEYENTNLIIYFSKIEDNKIFAEVLFNDNIKKGYKVLPVLGISLAYMISIDDNTIVSYSVKRISNN